MRPRVIATSTVVALAAVGGASGAARAAADDRGDKNSQLAEAQFEVHLLTNTDLVPRDVTCAPPPATDPDGAMLCYALVGERDSVAALAVPVSPGVYRFISVDKFDDTPGAPAPSPQPQPQPQPQPVPTGEDPQAPAPQNDADLAILDAVEIALIAETEIGRTMLETNPEISSVDEIGFYAPTATVLVSVTTSTESQGVRQAIAFSVTDVMAYLWEDGQPMRDASATIHPRLEVTVDGVLYGSSYDMMVGVADYTMTFTEWLDLSTGGGAYMPAGRLIDRRVEIKRKR